MCKSFQPKILILDTIFSFQRVLFKNCFVISLDLDPLISATIRIRGYQTFALDDFFVTPSLDLGKVPVLILDNGGNSLVSILL